VGVARGARREWALVVLVAVAGIALASLVAFAPWYEPAHLTTEAGQTEQATNVTKLLGALFR
jgi:hypothetical protein